MKRLVLVACLLFPAWCFGVGVTIDGPDKLDVKEAELFFVEGLTIEEFKSCAVHVRPEENKPRVLVLQTTNNLPVLFVKGSSPGKFDIILDVNIPTKYELVFHALQIGEGVDPVDPPDPIDPPLPPGKKWQVAVVYEKEDAIKLPAAQRLIISGLKFRDKLKAAGHKLVPGGIIDQHIVDADGSVPADLKPYLDAAKGKVMPRLCIAPISGGDVLDFPLPATEADVLELLEKGIKE